jgi:hypothetical protein
MEVFPLFAAAVVSLFFPIVFGDRLVSVKWE